MNDATATMRPEKAFVCRRMPEEIETALHERFSVSINQQDGLLTPDEIAQSARGASVLFVTATERVDRDLLSRLSPTLRTVATLSVGFDHIDLAAAQELGIEVLHTPGVLSEACAEIALMLLLNASRRGFEADRMVRTGQWAGWAPTQLLGRGLVGKRLGIFGMGRIGQAIAARARAFGMDIHYHNRSRLDSALAQGATYHATLGSLCACSNALVVAAPGTPELKGALDQTSIAALPRGAVVVNISRGDIIDDDALIDALRNGQVFAAGLDVFANEPHIDPRYRTLDNVFLSPHIGSATYETRNAMGWLLIDGITALRRGERPANLLTQTSRSSLRSDAPALRDRSLAVRPPILHEAGSKSIAAKHTCADGPRAHPFDYSTKEITMQTIGMIGIGMMGYGIATNVAKRGYPLVVLEHPGNQPLDTLIAAGATTAQTIPALAAKADIVILCVTGTPEVEDVLLRADGLLSTIRQGAIVIDCSTAIPSSTERIAAAVIKAGGRFIDAPMTRTPKEAYEGRLNLIVGGDEEVYQQCLPLLQSFAENITYAGPVGSGHRLKLLHNYVSLGFSAVLAEAAACSARAHVDPAVLIEVLSKGGGAGAILERLRPFIEHGDSSSFRFAISNALKDMTYYDTMASELGANHLAASAIRKTYAGAHEANASATVPELVALLTETTINP